MTKVKEIELDQLTQIRETSQKISQELQSLLSAHLATLTPLFAPRKVLGEFMDSAFADKVPGADKNFAKLEADYKQLCQTPFNIPAKLSTPVPNIKNELSVYPWCYPYTVGELELNISSPLRWVLGYAATYDLRRLMQNHIGKETPRYEDVKELLLTTLTMAYLLQLSPGLKSIIEGLNFTLTIEHSSLTGDLPFAVIGAPITTFRPQDTTIKTVAQLSGAPVFQELVDLEEVAALEHPFKPRLSRLIEAP